MTKGGQHYLMGVTSWGYGFIFKTLYARGIDNTTDAISRIENWESYDSDRFQTVEDYRDMDDNSPLTDAESVEKAKRETSEVMKMLDFMQ